MLALSWFNRVSISAAPSHQPPRFVYTHRKCSLTALFITSALICGTGSAALSQTAYFSGAQTTVGSGFYEPLGVAVDKNGNLYVGDADTYSITELMAINGVIPSSPTTRTLEAGWPNVEIPTGLTIDGNGNLFIADSYKNTVEEILAVNGSIPSSPTIVTLPGTFNSPWGIAVDAEGDLYVSEYYNSDIKEIVAVNGSIPAVPTIRTLGSGFLNPEGLAIDNGGNLYVADSQSHAIKEIVAVDGSIPDSPAIVTLASGYCSPDGVALDRSGDVFFSDYCNSGVYEIMAVNGTIPPSPVMSATHPRPPPREIRVEYPPATGISYSALAEKSVMKRLPAPSMAGGHVAGARADHLWRGTERDTTGRNRQCSWNVFVHPGGGNYSARRHRDAYGGVYT